MKRGVLIAVTGALFLAAWSSPSAAIKKWSMDAGLYGGYNQVDAAPNLENGLVYGARVGVHVMPMLMVEATFETFDTKSNDPKLADSDHSEKSAGLRIIIIFQPSEEAKFAPYVMAGGGYQNTEFDPGNGNPTEDDKAPYGEVGAGLRFFVWKNLNIRPEILLKHFRTLGDTHSDVRYTVGISYLFFGKK